MTDAREVAGKLTKAQTPVQWREVPGFEGFYSISDQGDVVSLPRMLLVKKPGTRAYHIPAGGRALKRTHSRKGYPQVGLSKNGEQYTKELHRLVCETFHGPAPDGCEAAHINGDKTDCRAVNLKWSSRSENALDKWRHGTMRHGSAMETAKLDAERVRQIFLRRNAGESGRSLAREFGVDEAAIRKIINRKSWRSVTDSLAVRNILEGEG